MALCLFGKIISQPKAQLIHAGSLKNLSPHQASFHGPSLKRMCLGFSNLTADLTWVALLQSASHEKLPAGEVSWEYAQLAAITTLDPRFEHAYEFGSAFLSVFREDKEGARLLLERWTRYFPNSWRAHFALGFHYSHELGNHKEGAQHLLAAAKLPGAPEYLASVGVRLLSTTLDYRFALSTALSLIPSLHSDEGISRLKKRIRSLHFALQWDNQKQALARFREIKHAEPNSMADLRPFLNFPERELSQEYPELPQEFEAILREKFSFEYNPKTGTIQPAGRSDLAELTSVAPHIPSEEPK